MTTISYYLGDQRIKKEIDKTKANKSFTITEGHLDLNERIGKHNEPKFISSNTNNAVSFQDAITIYKQKFDEYEKKSYDWKGHSAGCLKFYWNNGKTDVLTYLKLNYKGNEIMEFNFEEMGF